MKKLTSALSLLFGSLFLSSLAFAAATTTPTVDTPPSPVDANKAVISGVSEPGARVTVTGGPYEIAPTTADGDGNFSVTVGLAQESTNTFNIQATADGHEESEIVQVSIVESTEQTRIFEAQTGSDRTAPDAPQIDITSTTTDDGFYTITGMGEAEATVIVNNVASNENVDAEGMFSVQVALSGNGTTDRFNISLMDRARNIGAGVQVQVTGTGEPGELEEEGSEDENDGNEEMYFEDIQEHWGKEFIETLVELGAVNGFGDGTFRPDESVTRAQLLKMTLLAFGIDPDEDIEENPFGDVEDDDWFRSHVLMAHNMGVVEGFNDGSFKPNDEITRAAALKIVLLAAQLDSLDSDGDNFEDVDPEDWFYEYTQFAKENEIVSGYGDTGEFHGEKTLTRAQAAKIIQKVAELI